MQPMSATIQPTMEDKKVQSQTQVFCVHGADPEVQAYAMAKYSRSSLSIKKSQAELNEQKAEKFLNTFYFQYGHRSNTNQTHNTKTNKQQTQQTTTIVV